jgi:lipopolysaccharide transport system permease protein
MSEDEAPRSHGRAAARSREKPTSMKEIVIDGNASLRRFLRDLWDYRELFYFLAWRDFLVRYKQTVIGLAWSVLTPLITMTILTIVFGKLAKLPSGGSPYALMVFAALLPWQFFANTLTTSSTSLINNQNMVSKVFFPRIILPTTSMAVSFIDFMISFGILLALMLWYGVAPGPRFAILPLLLVIVALTSLGAGYLISALNVKYRDFRYVVPFIVQVGLYITPVGFSSEIVPERWRLLYSINPMVGVVDGFRWAILGEGAGLYLPGFFCSVAIAFALFTLGLAFFVKTERAFADVI